MNELIKNHVRIMEIYTDKPNLEDVFIELINRPVQKTKLTDLLDEIVPEEKSSASSENDEADGEKEDN